MAWLEITIKTPPGLCEQTAAALTARGFSDLVLEDQGELEGFLEENRDCWDYIDEELRQKLHGLSQIRLYLDAGDAPARARLEALTAELGLAMTAQALPEQDWSESWKDNYPPQEVGKNLVVLPFWRADEATGRTKIVLDPGLTFGTGAHPSTQMVMAALEERVTPGARCLDLGSGSGILSITALALGAGEAVGVDIDPKAAGAALENAGYNGFAPPLFTPLTADLTKDAGLRAQLAASPWDLVLVNIVADVIIALAPFLPELLAPGGTVLCSGILEGRLRDVTAALEAAGLTVNTVFAQEEWRCVAAGARKEDP